MTFDPGEGASGGPTVGPEPAWHEVVAGERVVVEVERRLYERSGDEHFLIRVRVRNGSDRAVGIDLRDHWTVVYPNQWGALPEAQRTVIDERRMPARVLDEARCADLQRAFSAGELAAVPPAGGVEYFREFNASGRADVDAQATDPFLYVSLSGQTLVTDGDRCENLALDGDSDTTVVATDLILAAPIRWGTVPAGAIVVGPEREHEVPGSDAVLAPSPARSRVPSRVGLQMSLPSPADARWLNVTVETGEEEWRIVGCYSNLEGGCDRTRLCPLDDGERAAYAARVAAVWAMPLCEPPASGPNHFRVELDLGGDRRRTWVPPGWLGLEGGGGPPVDDQPCLAEMRLAWWIYETFDRCNRAATAPAPRCHESCCPPALRGPGPDGTVECCFCEDLYGAGGRRK